MCMNLFQLSVVNCYKMHYYVLQVQAARKRVYSKAYHDTRVNSSEPSPVWKPLARQAGTEAVEEWLRNNQQVS